MSRYVLAAERAVLAGGLVAACASLPAALRIASDVPSMPGAWVAIAAILAVPSALAVLVGRLARDAWQELATGNERPVLVGVAIWIALCFPIDVVLAATLKATTHHRGLGGATFAVLSLVVALAAALVAMRIVMVTMAILERRARGRVALPSAVLVLVALALATPMGRAMLSGEWWSALPELVRATLVDGGVWLVVVAGAVWADRPSRMTKPRLVVGAASLLGIALAGLFVAHGSEAIATAIRDRAALAGPLGQLFGFV